MTIRMPHVAASTCLLAVMFLQACDLPPTDSTQIGYRGVGMEQVADPDRLAELKLLNQMPEPLPATPSVSGGPKAGDIYQNVEVLGDLGIAEFTRTMTAITNWVSPEQGCNYCHLAANFADDNLYTKRVSRRMMQMTMAINDEWQSHVGDTGVTCLTCHRGNNVPQEVWYEQNGPRTAAGMSARSYQQNHAAMNVGSTSMLSDPFTRYLETDPAPIRVIGQTALPLAAPNDNRSTTQQTEDTYSLMFHLSDALGVNCTYCHNSRAFTDWAQSPPARETAWHGLQMVPQLNAEYVSPLADWLPEKRLGERGDAPKINCATCHQGVNKPLLGQSMLEDYPVWRTAAE